MEALDLFQVVGVEAAFWVNYSPSVVGEGDEGGEQFAGGSVPDLRGLVITPGEHPPPVRGKGYAGDVV